ncbi:MAG: hypothetical protein ABIF19_03135 [Planctomycetota bacterium]
MAGEHRKLCLANPDTLLGMLQRGRGAGYLQAVETSPAEVWPLLMECITNDPRLDKQVEYRADYYCSLIIETRMDIKPIGDFLKQNDGRDDQFWNTILAIQTLDSLSARQNAEALEMFRDYMAYGFHWQSVALYLWESPIDNSLEGVDRTICDRLSNDPAFHEDFRMGILEGLKYWYDEDIRVGPLIPVCEPWKTLCQRNSQLAKAFDRFCLPEAIESLPRKENKAPIDLAGLSVGELFGLVERPLFCQAAEALEQKLSGKDEQLLLQNLTQEDEYRVMLALNGLGVLGTPTAFEAVRSVIESGEGLNKRIRRQAFKAIGRMPGSLSLETGRQWFQRNEWYLQVAGGEILENHATPDDVPLLVDVLSSPETIQCEDFRLASALEAFWHMDGVGHVPEIENVFVAVPHSCKRYRAARAMDATAPDVFQANYARECLWDCYWDTRICGCETAALSHPGVLTRLKEISQDPHESERVRESAQLASGEF